MKSKEEIEYWVFSSYKNENDYNNNTPFFEKEFTDFNKLSIIDELDKYIISLNKQD